MNIIDAVLSLNPKAELTVEEEDYSKITWRNKTTPIPQVEIQAEVIRLQEEFDSQAYARNRASAFQSIGIGDQLDMQYWDQVNGTTTWKDAVAKVKSDNPK